MSDRVGGWICTSRGVAFHPLDPRPEDVHVEDIAHALGNQCRFSGHVSDFYSVGEHSWRVSFLVEAMFFARPETSVGEVARAALVGLLHDASEAYMVDLPRPLKLLPEFEAYRVHEANLQGMIYRSFGLAPDETVEAAVHLADNILLATEKRDLMPQLSWNGEALRAWAPLPPPLEERIEPWAPGYARTRFLHRYKQLKEAIR